MQKLKSVLMRKGTAASQPAKAHSSVVRSALQGRQPSQGTLGRSQTARGGFSPTPWLAPHTASRKAPGAPLGTARAR